MHGLQPTCHAHLRKAHRPYPRQTVAEESVRSETGLAHYGTGRTQNSTTLHSAAQTAVCHSPSTSTIPQWQV